MAIEGVGGLLTRIAFGVRVHWMHPFGGLRLSHGHKISDALTYLEGDTVSLGTTDHERLKSEDTKTHTMQVGAMLRGTTPENISWRFGLAYEHVADGDAESTVFTKTDLVALDIPTLEGDSGIVDLGITMRSKPTDPMALDLGLKGYVGDYQGVTGTVTWSYAF